MNARGLVLAGLSAATLLLMAAPAQSDDPSAHAEARKYASFFADAVFTHLPNDQVGDGTRKGELQDASSSGTGGGFGIVAGIRSNAWVAFEVQYEYLVGTKLSGCLVRDDRVDQWNSCVSNDGRPGLDRKDVQYSQHDFWFQTKIFPLHALLDKRAEGRFQPYIKAGGGAMIVVDLGTKTPIAFAGRVGAGADYHMGENWSIGLDFGYMLPTGNLTGLNTVTLGVGASYYWY